MNVSLPSYPLCSDLWTYLKQTKKPILMYGMGNGAEKILCELDKREIVISDFFASDGFVRGHSFHSKTVLSYSQAKEKYGCDFIVLLAFGSSLDSVIDNILKISSEVELYAPDVPVCHSPVFDCNFYNSHYEEIIKAYDALADDTSKSIYTAIINYKLSGDIRYLINAPEDDGSSLFSYSNYRVCVDAGAYRGESSRELLSLSKSIEKIHAIEPDRRSYKKLLEYANSTNGIVTAHNCGVWNEASEGAFSDMGNRNSSFVEDGKLLTKLDKIDSIIGEDIPDYIKYDVEGCEAMALDGSKKTISEYYPELLVCVYHKSDDIFSLINKINAEYNDYKLYLRKKKYIPAWDVYICAIKEKR